MNLFSSKLQLNIYINRDDGGVKVVIYCQLSSAKFYDHILELFIVNSSFRKINHRYVTTESNND